MPAQRTSESEQVAAKRIERSGGSCEEARGPAGPINPLLKLQRALGNRRVSRLVQSGTLRSGAIRPKLTVGAADDTYEQEADRVARAVLSLSDADVSRSLRRAALPDEDRERSLQQRRQVDRRSWPSGGEAESVQRETVEHRAGSFDAGDDIERQLGLSKGRGTPLPDPVRAFMEPRFGVDFGHVRVHQGTDAEAMNAAVGARAFTHGEDIYYGAGQGPADLALTAHELTHVVQQTGARPLQGKAVDSVLGMSEPSLRRTCAACAAGGAMCPRCAEEDARLRRKPRLTEAAGHTEGNRSWRIARAPLAVQRYSWDEFTDDVASAGEAVAEGAEAVGEAVVSGAETVAEGAVAAGEAVVSGAEAVVEAGAEAVDWLATEAGRFAERLADSLGGVVSITTSGLVVTLPRFCPIDALPFSFDLESMEREFMVPVAGLPLGTLVITGEVGLVGRLQPAVQIQLGPFCLNGVRILINPITNTYSISGSVSATAASSLGAEVRGGLRGALSLKGVVPIGEIPVPVDVPLAGIEGGLAGYLRGIGAATLTIGQGLSIGGGAISLRDTRQLDLGLAGDLFLGAYGQLDIEGENVCRLYWQPLEWHGDIAGSLGLSLGLTIVPGARPVIVPDISPPTFARIPFDQIPLVLSRAGFSDNCPIKDRICEVLSALNLLPSQNGGSWNWAGPYGPGPRLPGPLDVYEKNPGIASGSECRGACGPNCDTCAPVPAYRYADPATGEVWEYTNFQDCNSNAGCREHDAAFDWAAAEHGERGRFAIILPWHMAANIECTCNNLAGNCIAWIAGLPPYDSTLYFADAAALVARGGGGSSSSSCREDYPNAPDCTGQNPDRDTVLSEWGLRNGIDRFEDCRIVQDWSAASFIGCEGGPGKVWHCRAVDLGSGRELTVSIVECICCDVDDASGSEWSTPAVVIDEDMPEEFILDLCDRGLIPREICIPIEEDMIARFGNRRRNLDLNPDEDPEAHPRPDDAPIMASFRRMYNRLDSWNFFIRTNHPDWYPEFQSRFRIEESRDRWIADLKERTKRYKQEFRNLRETDVEAARRRYETYVLSNIQDEIEARNREIAAWYRDRTGSTESIEEIIERVHREGTELWRAAWRRAILQVNRVLARLWPPAKTRILLWVGQQRVRFPHLDLSGSVGELDYIGSLATGYKGPPKQQIRFNPDRFDVDANLAAPPLAKYAVAVDGLRPDRQRIFGRHTSIAPLNQFSDQAHAELGAHVQGYDTGDPFDVAVEAAELPEQTRERLATERLYRLRSDLDEAAYGQMLDELIAGGYLTADGRAVRGDLTDTQFAEMSAIMDRYESRSTPQPTP